MSADRLQPPPGIAEMLEKAEERGRRMERVDIAYELGIIDLSHFCYNPENTEEILRLRDEMSERVLKGRK